MTTRTNECVGQVGIYKSPVQEHGAHIQHTESVIVLNSVGNSLQVNNNIMTLFNHIMLKPLVNTCPQNCRHALCVHMTLVLCLSGRMGLTGMFSILYSSNNACLF